MCSGLLVSSVQLLNNEDVGHLKLPPIDSWYHSSSIAVIDQEPIINNNCIDEFDANEIPTKYDDGDDWVTVGFAARPTRLPENSTSKCVDEEIQKIVKRVVRLNKDLVRIAHNYRRKSQKSRKTRISTKHMTDEQKSEHIRWQNRKNSQKFRVEQKMSLEHLKKLGDIFRKLLDIFENHRLPKHHISDIFESSLNAINDLELKHGQQLKVVSERERKY
ncbi:unnamed protein product [Caenorhabditis bovis]|uniref:Uncharacterized protein n=1 Tax=Caenorhabditis bovis TaxID=2654633 RepID=A0A8S1F0E9_9PELO|nr:unnamed protein product [Caenorhabditis bovis]